MTEMPPQRLKALRPPGRRHVRRVRKGLDRARKGVDGLIKDHAPRPVQKAFVRARGAGPVYGLLYGCWALTSLASQRLADRLISMEGERGVLGPFLRDYDQHTVRDNRTTWTEWDWRRRGEEWSQSEEWKRSLIEHVLRPYMPRQGAIVEIGPGGGRWSEALLELARELILVDVTERALEVCRERFGALPNLRYVLTSGSDIPDVADHSADAVWSFDAFVHIAPRDIDDYLKEIDRVLRPGGVAVIHHSGRALRKSPHGWRSPMTARLFGNLARKHGLNVERQFDTWGDGYGVRNDAVRPPEEERFPQNGDLLSVLRAPEVRTTRTSREP